MRRWQSTTSVVEFVVMAGLLQPSGKHFPISSHDFLSHQREKSLLVRVEDNVDAILLSSLSELAVKCLQWSTVFNRCSALKYFLSFNFEVIFYLDNNSGKSLMIYTTNFENCMWIMTTSLKRKNNNYWLRAIRDFFILMAAKTTFCQLESEKVLSERF